MWRTAGLSRWAFPRRESGLSPARLGKLVRWLLGGPARWAALVLLETASDAELDAVLAADGALLDWLARQVPEGHPLRGRGNRLGAGRFAGGFAALATGRVKATGQPGAEFDPGQLDSLLDGFRGCSPDGSSGRRRG